MSAVARTPEEVEQEHFAMLKSMDFLQVMETEAGVVVLLIGKYFSWQATKGLLPSLYKFIAARLEAVSSQPYSILYVHTDCYYSQNSPGVWWLWRAYSRLPQRCRDNLQACYVLHPDWALSLTAAAVCPWVSGGFWGKVRYVDRSEFLPPAMQELELPKFVEEHEQTLAKHPLVDYGIAADVDETPLPQLSQLK